MNHRDGMAIIFIAAILRLAPEWWAIVVMICTGIIVVIDDGLSLCEWYLRRKIKEQSNG